MALSITNWIAKLAICLGLVAASASPALAMRVSPMVLEMESRGGDSVARVEVQNVNPTRLAFETRIYRMEIGDDGEITETPADEEFLVFPPQGVLGPSGRQVIRLQWVGDPQLDRSQAFYVSVNQLPVAFEPSETETVGAQVQVLYHMRALAVVAPPGAEPKVRTDSIELTTYSPPPLPGSNETMPEMEALAITLRNDGQRHAMMSNFGWIIEGKDKDGGFLRVDVSPEELSQAVGTGYVPALGKRTFILPVPGFSEDGIKLSFASGS